MKDTSDTQTTDMFEDPLVVYYKGKPALKLNKSLIDAQQIDDEGIEDIKILHCIRLYIEEQMQAQTKPEYIKEWYKLWVENQYQLQAAWGFPQDANFHPSHRLHHCACPVMDNDERLGTPYRVTNSDCILHG
jgi:hypothetical protein